MTTTYEDSERLVAYIFLHVFEGRMACMNIAGEGLRFLVLRETDKDFYGTEEEALKILEDSGWVRDEFGNLREPERNWLAHYSKKNTLMRLKMIPFGVLAGLLMVALSTQVDQRFAITITAVLVFAALFIWEAISPKIAKYRFERKHGLLGSQDLQES